MNLQAYHSKRLYIVVLIKKIIKLPINKVFVEQKLILKQVDTEMFLKHLSIHSEQIKVCLLHKSAQIGVHMCAQLTSVSPA